MSPKTRGTLKQQALGFTTKRSTATSNLKSKQPLNSPVSVPTTPKPVAVVESTEASGVEVEAKETVVRSSPRQRKTRAASKAESNAASKKRKLQEVEEAASPTEKEKRNLEKGKGVFKSRVSLENVEGRATPTRVDDSSDTESDDPRDADTSDAAKKLRIRRHYGQVREKMGFLAPIHAKGQTKEHHILRVFDLSYEYGPCIGMTRLQRWERAEAMGLNPPLAVKEILVDEQAKDGSTLGECVFFGEV